MNESQVRRHVCEIVPELRDRLIELGEPGPGQCLPTSLIAAAMLKQRGLDAVIQSGHCTWRRLSVSDAAASGEEETAYFGYEWGPENPVSRALLGRGVMPEYHCWVAVLGSHPVAADYVAYQFPGLSRGTLSIAGEFVVYDHFSGHVHEAPPGRAWSMPEPGSPHVMNEADMRAAYLAGPDGPYCYMPIEEASIFAILVAQQFICRMLLLGRRVGDLWAGIPGGCPEHLRNPITAAKFANAPPRHLLAMTRSCIERASAAGHPVCTPLVTKG
jgi:hypothetical protein